MRQKFFEMARTMMDASPEEIAASATDYRIWFESVEVPRRIELADRSADIDAAYLDRVRRSLSLLRSFLDDPVRSIDPIVLRVIDDVPTVTGKRIPTMLQPADGCHRLALLRMAGATTLLPGDYRIERLRRPATDNTHRLLSELAVPIDEYLEFIGSAYGVSGAVSADDLIACVQRSAPERVEEVTAILDIDLRGNRARTEVV